MFFILSKVLSFIIQPLNWLLLLLVAAAISKTNSNRKKFAWASLCFFLFFSNPFVINTVYRVWEWDPVPIRDLPQFEIAIVLGGFSSPNNLPSDRAHFHKGIDRFTNALELYHKGKIKKIVLTGGSNKILGEKVSEGMVVNEFMKTINFPMVDFLVEPRSRNTYENAIFTRHIRSGICNSNKVPLRLKCSFIWSYQ